MINLSLGRVAVLIIVAVAVWRLSSLFAVELGPFSVFEKIRFSARNSKYKIVRDFSPGIECVWCNSVWFGALFAVFIATGLFEWIVFSLALSAVAIMINSRYGG